MMAECSVRSFIGSNFLDAELNSCMAWVRVLALRIAAGKFDETGEEENGDAEIVLEMAGDFMQKMDFKF